MTRQSRVRLRGCRGKLGSGGGDGLPLAGRSRDTYGYIVRRRRGRCSRLRACTAARPAPAPSPPHPRSTPPPRRRAHQIHGASSSSPSATASSLSSSGAASTATGASSLVASAAAQDSRCRRCHHRRRQSVRLGRRRPRAAAYEESGEGEGVVPSVLAFGGVRRPRSHRREAYNSGRWGDKAAPPPAPR